MTRKMNSYVERSQSPNRTNPKSKSRKAITDNLNPLDELKVGAKAVRERYSAIKAHFEEKEKEEKRASGINLDATSADTAPEEHIERERECVKNFED